MKKKFVQILCTTLLIILFFCNLVAFAADTATASLKMSKTSLHYAKSWGNREVLAGVSSITNINGSNLTTLPKVVLESTDGKVQQWVYVEKQGNNTYFDVVFGNLDFSKKYIVKVKSNEPKSTADFEQLTLANDFIVISEKNTYVTIKDNEISFARNYNAPVSCSTANLYYTKSWGNREVLAATSAITEVCNGKTMNLTNLPKVILESTDGKVQQWVYVEKQGDKTYFDVAFNNLDYSKKYVLKVKSNNKGNIADFKQLPLANNFIAISAKNTYVTIKDNVITFARNYNAPVSCSTASLYYTKSWGNREVLAATSNITESYNGKSVSLTNLPKVILESTDGKVQQWVYVEKQGDKTYFDVVFNNLDYSKKYVLKVKSNNSGNIADFKQLSLANNFIAIKAKNTYVTIQDNVITFSRNYSAKLTTSSAKLYHTKSWGNRNVIAGTIDAYEMINGKRVELVNLPKIIVESKDGKEQRWVYVEKQGNKIYFDFTLEDLSSSKDYIIKIKSNEPGNTSGYEQIKLTNGFVPDLTTNKYYTVKDNAFNLSTNFTADLGFKSVDLYFVQDTSYKTYIAGMAEIFVTHASGTKFAPPSNPIIELISTDGTVNKRAYVERVGEKFYFSINLDELDLSKTYYIKIQENSKNNMSENVVKNLWVQSVSNNVPTYSVSEKNSYLTFSKKMEVGIYGKSGLKVKGDSRGTDLKYYKIGHGPNVYFATFALHGYEDLWARDGKELTYIAEEFVKKITAANDPKIMNNWTIYVFPQCNPDGVNYGTTKDGAGRCTVTSTLGRGIDMNRCWSAGFKANYTNRNYTGSQAFAAYEAQYLRDFMLKNKSQTGQTVVIDLHGWTTQLIGDYGICMNYFAPQFYGSAANGASRYTSSYGSGYMINWARTNLGNSNKTARSALIELPSAGINGHTSVVNNNYAGKYYNSVVNMLKGLV